MWKFPDGVDWPSAGSCTAVPCAWRVHAPNPTKNGNAQAAGLRFSALVGVISSMGKVTSEEKSLCG